MREKRDHGDISFRRSLTLFLFVFVVSFVIGMVARQFIYSQPLDEMISEKLLENERYPLKIEGVTLKFRQGWLPAFAIYVDRIAGLDKQCSQRQAVATNVFVSLKLLRLFEGQVEPNRVYVDNLSIKVPKHCPKAVGVVADQGDRNVASENPVGISDEFSPRELFKVYDEQLSGLFLPYLRVRNLVFEQIHGEATKLKVIGELIIKSTKDSVVANISPKKIFVKESQLPVSKGLLSLALGKDKFHVHYDTYLREGHFNASGEVVNDESLSTSVSADLNKIPVSIFSQVFFHKAQLQYLWANCKFTVGSPWKDVGTKKFELEDCGLSGPYGSARVQKSELSLSDPKNLVVEINKIDLDQVIKSKREVFLSGIFHHYGEFSGIFEFSDKKKWSMQGHFIDSEVQFSRDNFRELQKIVKLPFHVQGAQGGWWALTTKNIKIEKGQFKGEISLRFDDKVKQGQAKVALHSIQLSPKIYRLMLHSKATPLSVYAKINVNEGQVQDWNGVIATKSLETDNISLSGLKVEGSQIKGQKPVVEVFAQSGRFSEKSKILSWLSPTTFETAWSDVPYGFKEMSLKFVSLGSDDWNWKRGYVRLSNGWQLSSEGRLDRKSNLKGWLQWDIPNQKVLRWNYVGFWDQGQWTPQEQWMKSWLQENSEYLNKNRSIAYNALEETEEGSEAVETE